MPNIVSPASVPLGITNPVLANASALRKVSWIARGNSTTIDNVGTAPTIVSNAGSTATARNWASTSLLTRSHKVGLVTTTSAGTFAEAYGAALQFYPGSLNSYGQATDGGFIFQAIINLNDASTVSGARSFVGMTGTASALTNVEPNTLTNSLGFCQLSTDTNWYFMYGGSTITTVPLGANFPCDNNQLIEFGVVVQPGSTQAQWYAWNYTLDTGAGTAAPGQSGVVTHGIAATQALAPKVFRTNNAQTIVAGIDFHVVNVLSFF